MKYIGVKLVEAEPMTAQRAESVGYSIGSCTGTVQGMEVIYEDGYKSWCPEHVFVRNNRPLTGMTYGMAIECMKLGMAVARKGWNGKGMFICKLISADINGSIVPNMQSLPDAAKELIMSHPQMKMDPEHNSLRFENQMILVNTNTLTANSWVASSSDTFAEDYYVYEPQVA